MIWTYSVVEASMVRLGELDDELSSTLITYVYVHAGFLQPLRVHESHQLEKEIRLSFEEIRCFAANGRFEFLRVFARNAIPRLRFSPVHCGE